MLTNRDRSLLEAVRRRHAARHARERAKSIVRKDRRDDTLAAGRAHRAMLKLYTQADAEHRYYDLHPDLASVPALIALGAELRHAVDDVRSRAAKCAGSSAADAMRLRLRADASVAMRLVRRIAAIKTNTTPPPQPAQQPFSLTPIVSPPAPFERAPLYYTPDPNAPPEVRRSEYHWEKLVRRLDGSLKEWQAQRKAATERYLQSDKGKEARKRYMQSEKGKEARKRYMQSEKGKEARKRAQAAYRARKAASTLKPR